MDGFSYYNIFETKGIEYLVIITFFLILIPFWVTLNKQVKLTKQIQKTLGILTSKILKIPQGLFYSENHTWAFMKKSGEAKVGLNDLLQHITGEVKFNSLKNPGEIIRKGDLLAKLDKNGKQLMISSPISGEILQTNYTLNERPEVLNEDPYEKGWIYEIKPLNWKAETDSCYMAEDATKWASNELVRFKDFLAVSMGKHIPEVSMISMQDGGELCDNTLSELPNEVWQDFQKEFL